MSLHVAQFVHRYPPALGGAEAYAARLSRHLSRCGDRVTVWTTAAVELTELWQGCRRESVTTEHRPSGGETIRRYHPLAFPLRRYLLKAGSLLPVRAWQCLSSPCNPICPRMWRDAGRYDGPLDAVHATAFPYSFPILCGLRLARRRRVPFLLTPFMHLGDPDDPDDPTRRQYTRPHLRWLLRQADGVFVQTAIEREQVLSLGVPAGRVELTGLGVEPRECRGGDRERIRAEWGVAAGEVVIGHLANNSEEKGTCDLLRAAARAWDEGLRFRVVLAGPEMPNFRRFWLRFPHPERVVRLGVLTDAQKRDFYAGLDLFALPSRSDSFGLVLLEAWANGKPNLVYRAGGPAELIRHETDGLQARCGDLTDLARQIGRLVRDPHLRRRLGDNGQARLATEFRWTDKLARIRDRLAAAVDDYRRAVRVSHRPGPADRAADPRPAPAAAAR